MGIFTSVTWFREYIPTLQMEPHPTQARKTEKVLTRWWKERDLLKKHNSTEIVLRSALVETPPA